MRMGICRAATAFPSLWWRGGIKCKSRYFELEGHTMQLQSSEKYGFCALLETVAAACFFSVSVGHLQIKDQ